MADVGGSTTGRVSRRETMYAVGHDALSQWGAMQRALSDGSPGDVAADPMFRDVRSGYRESSALPFLYDEDYALLVDTLLGRVLQAVEIEIATLAYVRAMPSAQAAKALDKRFPRPWPARPGIVTSWDEKRRPRWTGAEYRSRLDEVVARVDVAVTVATMDTAM